LLEERLQKDGLIVLYALNNDLLLITGLAKESSRVIAASKFSGLDSGICKHEGEEVRTPEGSDPLTAGRLGNSKVQIPDMGSGEEIVRTDDKCNRKQTKPDRVFRF